MATVYVCGVLLPIKDTDTDACAIWISTTRRFGRGGSCRRHLYSMAWLVFARATGRLGDFDCAVHPSRSVNYRQHCIVDDLPIQEAAQLSLLGALGLGL
jgi:hypothetical protein